MIALVAFCVGTAFAGTAKLTDGMYSDDACTTAYTEETMCDTMKTQGCDAFKEGLSSEVPLDEMDFSCTYSDCAIHVEMEHEDMCIDMKKAMAGEDTSCEEIEGSDPAGYQQISWTCTDAKSSAATTTASPVIAIMISGISLVALL